MIKTPSDKVPFLIAGIFTLALGVLHFLGIFSYLDNKWADLMFRSRGMQPADPRISIVAIDDESIRAIGRYPWPRGVYSRLLDRLFSAGVKVVGLDVLFTDPSLPEEDKALVQATAKWRERVVHSIDVDFDVHTHYQFRLPFPDLAGVSKFFGVVNQFLIDSDGVVRKTLLIFGRDRNHWNQWLSDPDRQPLFGLRVLSVFEGKSPDDYLRGGNVLLLNPRGESFREIWTEDGRGGKIRSSEPLYGIRRISAIRVLRGDLSEDQKKALSGGIVLIGSTAIGAYDHFPSPFSELSPGVEVHANVIDNLLNHRAMRPLPAWCLWPLVVGFAFFSAWSVTRTPLVSTLLVSAMFLGWFGANFFAFKRLWVLPFAFPISALAGPSMILAIRRAFLEHREKRFIKDVFGQFVAPEVVEDLIRNPSRMKLGGEKREMTVLFLDIANFSSIAEKMDPEALIQFLNRYLSVLSEVIHKHKGVVDKYIGDCIMAFWSAPIEQRDHRKLACLAAVEFQEAMEDLNRQMGSKGEKLPNIRVGINSGQMTVGLTGSRQKLQYTVIGDEVNLASRLEGANKFFGSRILVSHSCYQGAKDFVEARNLGKIRVAGKAVPIRVYELLGMKGRLLPAWSQGLPVYEEGILAFEKKDFAKAKLKFSRFLEIIPEDPVAKLYLNMTMDYSAVPPMESWDGVFNLAAK